MSILQLGNYDLQEVFLSKVTHFSEGNKVVHVPVCNTDGCLWRDSSVSSIQLNRPLWNYESLSPLWKTHIAGGVHFKN
jgi:hypothetical protein